MTFFDIFVLVNYQSDETNANIMPTLSVGVTHVLDNLKEIC